MSKLRLGFYGFALTVIVLFAVFSYLMTTVNPDSAPRGPPAGDHIHDPAFDHASADLIADHVLDNNAVKDNKEDVNEGRKFIGPVPECWNCTASSNITSFTATTESDQKSVNNTPSSKSSKGRRSIDDLWKKNDKRVVVLKILGDGGEPRVEIVFHPKRARYIKWKNNYRPNNLYPKKQNAKRRSDNFIYNSVLSIMPDDTVVLENADNSLKEDLEVYDKISETAKITENTKDISERISTLKYDQEGTLSRSIAKFWFTTKKAQTSEAQFNNTENIQGAFDSRSLWTNYPKTNDNITWPHIITTEDITYTLDSQLPLPDVNNIDNIVTTTPTENVYYMENVTYADRKETIDVTVSNENVILVDITTPTKQIYDIENVIVVDITTPTKQIYDIENVTYAYADQKEATDVTVSNVDDTENLTLSVVIENTVYSPVTNFTTVFPLVGENGTASPNDTLSKVGYADGIKTAIEISSDNATPQSPSAKLHR